MSYHNGIYAKISIDQKLFKFKYFLKIAQTRGFNKKANSFWSNRDFNFKFLLDVYLIKVYHSNAKQIILRYDKVFLTL